MNIEALLKWSQAEFSRLPWRLNRTIYRTLVSEIMLQQTTVSTVLNHFERFIAEYPNLTSIAKASEEELLIAWKGLGYYRRAKNLKKIAEYLCSHFNSTLPSDYQTLIQIPGIGPYTANALIAIGHNKEALAVDANLERVISRLYGLTEEKGKKLQEKIQLLYNEKKIFPDITEYRLLNEALMDLGRTSCQARRVSCDLCLMRTDCVAFKKNKPLFFPVSGQEKKLSQKHDLHLLRIVVRNNEEILAFKKSEGEWLAGQFELPTFIVSSTDNEASQYPKIKFKTENLPMIKTSITKYKISNWYLEMSKKEFAKLSFPHKLIWLSSKKEANLSTASLKILKKLKNREQE